MYKGQSAIANRRDKPRNLDRTLTDLADGLRRWPLWWALARQDVLRRYRGSILGPLWITLSMGVTVAAIGLIWSQLFKIPVADYIPFLCLGIMIWTLITNLFIDGCNSFISAQGMIQQTNLPISLFVYKSVCNNLLLLLHNAAVFAVVVVFFPVPVGMVTLLAIPGLLLLVVNGVWVGLFFGTVCARYRDLPPIVTSVLQVAFFVTPVFWKPEQFASRSLIVDANPFHHALALVRQPLLGQAPQAMSWLVIAAIAVAGWVLTLAVLARYRRQIVFWV